MGYTPVFFQNRLKYKHRVFKYKYVFFRIHQRHQNDGDSWTEDRMSTKN